MLFINKNKIGYNLIEYNKILCYHYCRNENKNTITSVLYTKEIIRVDKMPKNKKNELIEYIVKNQYALTYDLAKEKETFKAPDSKLNGKNIRELIYEIPGLIEQIDSSNLMILGALSTDDITQKITTELSNRSTRGESICYGGKVENQLFYRYELNKRTFANVYQENPQIKEKILKQEVAKIRENPRLLNIAKKARDIITIESLYESQKRGYITDESLEFLESLIKKNPHIIDSIDMRILNPEVLCMNKKFLQRVSRYKDHSTELITIYKTNPKLFQVFAEKIDEWENTLSTREATNLEKALLRYGAVYAPLMNDAKEEEFDDILEFCLRKQSFEFGKKTEYKVNMKDYYSSIYDKMIDEKIMNKPDKFSVLNAYCMKYLGMNANMVKTLFERKLDNVDIQKIEDYKLKGYIEKVKEFISLDSNNPDDIQKIITLYKNGGQTYSPREVVSFEDQINSMILETYEQGFIDTKSKLEETSDIQMLDFNGQKVKQINVNGKFSMIIRSTDTGFGADKQLENDSVKEYDENNPDPAVNIKSCTYVTEDFTGVAPLGENGAYLVYLNNDRNNMGEIGNGDIDSNIINYGVTSKESKSLTSDKLVDNCRQIYSEATLIGDISPDAIAIFDDSTERQRALALQAAAEYGVNLLYINKEKIVEEQISRLSELEKEFKKTGDLKQLSTLISKYETNIAGWLLNRDSTVKDDSLFVGIDNTKFLPQFNQKENDIYKAISDFCKQKASKKDIMKVVDILKSEQSKYNNLHERKNFPNLKMKFRAQELIEILNKKYDLGLDIEQSDQALQLYSELNPDEVMQSIAEKALDDGMVTQETLSRGKKLIAELDKDRGVSND